MLTDREQKIMEKQSMIFYQNLWKNISSWIGAVVSLCVIVAGIYFSQVTFAALLGNDSDMMVALSYSMAIMISSLEVVGLMLLGDKFRAMDIKSSSKTEYFIMDISTKILFVFDILSNMNGLYTTVQANIQEVNLISWVFIIGASILMGGGEIILGWMIRGISVSYVIYSGAKKIVDGLQSKLDKEEAEKAEEELNTLKENIDIGSNRSRNDRLMVRNQ